LLSFVSLATFPGEIAPSNPQATDFLPGLGPSRAHWFGTTAYGQDVLSQVIWATRQSLLIAFAVGGLATVLAVLVGVSAAYLGGGAGRTPSLSTGAGRLVP